jgi:hypothetical protein
MTSFSPASAAFEGFRVMRREPKAVLYWFCVWAATLVAIGIVIAALNAAGLRPFGSVRKFGPLAAVAAPALLALWVMHSATVYRAVLTPGEHGWHLFKLGAEEARIALVTAVGTVLLALLSGVPAYLLLVLLSPVFEAAPSLNRITAIAGWLATIVIEIWIAVRFSLAPAETFAQKSFPVRAYWSLTRGFFWRLLASYVLLAIELFGVSVVLGLLGVVVGDASSAALRWRNPDLAQRLLLSALVLPTAALGAAWNVAFWTLFSACQAYAYRAIAKSRQTVAEPA